MSNNSLLQLTDIHAAINGQEIIHGLDLTIQKGEVHAIMGPNGSGKSTLAYTLMGHPSYKVTEGTVLLNNTSLLELSVDKRAKEGLFLAFQYPFEVEGVPLRDFLRQSYNALYGGTDKQLGIKDFRKLLDDKMNLLGIAPDFIDRHLNIGFSGGEKKRAEMLQLAVLQPRLAILDEIDSGLDIDALRIVCSGLNSIRADNPEMSILLITHYQRILSYIKPDFVHVMQNGKIIRSGTLELAHELEQKGYGT